MAYNGSGVFNLSDTVTNATTIDATEVNAIFQDLADGLSGAVAKDGQSTMTGPIKAADGSITAPGVAFGSDLNTGFYRSASGVIRATCDGTNSFTATAAGASITGTCAVSGVLTATGGIAGGGIVPSGGIIMWSGSVATIPTGWLICDGANSTPDLRDKFVIGARQDDSGTAKTNVTGALTQSGGSTDAVNVSHTHTATVTDPSHDHDLSGTYTTEDNNLTAGSTRPLREGSSSAGTFTSTTEVQLATTGVTVANSTEGSSGTNANLPPYYALAFIMKS